MQSSHKKVVVLAILCAVFFIADIFIFIHSRSSGNSTSAPVPAQTVTTSPQTPTVSSATTTTSTSPTSPQSVNPTMPLFNPFIDPTPPANVSTVVGYYGYSGAFISYVPDWLVYNKWTDTSIGGTSSPLVFDFAPPSNTNPDDFSDIVMTISTSSESYNAETLYENMKNTLEAANSTTQTYTFESLSNTEGNLTVYHVQIRDTNTVQDTFYLDSENSANETAEVSFSASKNDYQNYAPGLLEFVIGLGSGEPSNG